MSKDLQFDDPADLDEDDLRYAISRGMVSDLQLRELGIEASDKQRLMQHKPLRVEEIANTGHAGFQVSAEEQAYIEELRRQRSDQGGVPTIVPDGISRALDESDDDETESSEVPDGAGPPDYSEMTGDELRVLCLDRGLDPGGRKAEMIDRLITQDAENA